mgnify:CR=1 FL=1
MATLYTNTQVTVDSSETTSGKIRIATAAEATAGTNNTTAITPKSLQDRLNALNISGGVTYKGVVSAVSIPTALVNGVVGDLYKISVAGSAAGLDWDIGDNVLVNTDMGGTFDAAKINKLDSTDSDLATVATSGLSTDLTDANTIVRAANNLSDLNNTTTARTNLGLGTSAVLDAGTSATNVIQLDSNAKIPAVDGSLLTNITATDSSKLAIANNLSDLNNAGTARTNLGLGTAAVAADTDFLSGTGSDTLGGDLDVGSSDIISSSNANIEFAPHGSGTVTIKGNTGGSGRIVLNCEQNSHGITIKGPPHSAGATYTLTLPDNDGNLDDVLQTDGNGNLSWTAQSSGGGGGASAPTVTEKNSSQTLTVTSGVIEEIITVSSSSAVTLTLPSSATLGEGFKYQIKRLGTGAVTIQCGGSEFIDHSGQTSFSIGAQYDSITLAANGTSPNASWLLI